jgi:hypothetical protein
MTFIPLDGYLFSVDNVHHDIDIGNGLHGKDNGRAYQFPNDDETPPPLANNDQSNNDDWFSHNDLGWGTQQNGEGTFGWQNINNSDEGNNSQDANKSDNASGAGSDKWGYDDQYSDNDQENKNNDDYWGMSITGTKITVNGNNSNSNTEASTVRESVLRPWSHKRKEVYSDDDSEEETISTIKNSLR